MYSVRRNLLHLWPLGPSPLAVEINHIATTLGTYVRHLLASIGPRCRLRILDAGRSISKQAASRRAQR